MKRLGHSKGDARGPRPQVLLALWAAGLVLFNFPLLIVWNADASVFGLPLLPVALFAIWAGLIAALAFASEGRSRRVRGPRHGIEGGEPEGAGREGGPGHGRRT